MHRERLSTTKALPVPVTSAGEPGTRRTKQGSTTSATGSSAAGAAAATPARDTAAGGGRGLKKQSTTAPAPKSGSTPPPALEGASVLAKASPTERTPPATHPPPPASTPLLPLTMTGATARRRASSVATLAETAVPSQARRSARASASKPTTSATSSSAECHRTRSLSISKDGAGKGVRHSLHLPDVRKDADAAPAAKSRGRDGKVRSSSVTPLKTAVAATPTSAVLVTPSSGRRISSSSSSAAAEALPPLRALASGSDSSHHHPHRSAAASSRQAPGASLGSVDLHRSPPLAPASHISTPVDRVPARPSAISPLLTSASPPSALPQRTSTLPSNAGGAVGSRGPPHATATPHSHGSGRGAVGAHPPPTPLTPPPAAAAAAVVTSNQARGVAAPVRRVCIDTEEDDEEDDDEEDDEEDEDEEEDEEDDEDGDEETDEEGDTDEDSGSSAEEEDEEEEEAMSSSSSSSASVSAATAATAAAGGSRASRKKTNKKRADKATPKRRSGATAAAAMSATPSNDARLRGAPAIRTKVSREGDMNVKVILATRSRHCFRRYLKEVMTRFGFQKPTDFDMYCIDRSGDRVDIDMEEDFDLLLDAFTAAMTVGEESQGEPLRTRRSPTPPTSVSPASHGLEGNHSTSSWFTPAASGDGAASRGGVRARGQSCNTSHNQASSFYAAQSFSLSPVLMDATTVSSISTGGLGEDDGKSSGSVLRLYVRYSNAYFTEHRLEFQQQQQQQQHMQQQQYPLYSQGVMGNGAPPQLSASPTAASLFTNQLQQLALSSPSSGALPTDGFAAGPVSPAAAGSPFSRTLLASTAGSTSLAVGGSRDDFSPSHAPSLPHPHHLVPQSSTPPDSVSLQFNETLRNSLAKTFRLEEGELVDWRRMSVLGKGSFGTVYEGITQDGKLLAVKVQELPLDDGEDAEAVRALQSEINLMRSLKHRNIVAYYGCQTRALATGSQQMEVFLELCHGGSLASLRRKFMKAKEHFSISLVRSYTRQVLEGLAYLHAQRVVHRDIKSDNVLISAMGEAKLADFGCSKRLGPATLQGGVSGAPPSSQDAAVAHAAMYQTMVGSPFFMAPEVLREDGGYTGAADIWSVGCLVVELLGREPWDITGTNIFQIMFRISKEKGMPSGVPKDCPALLLDFFERCFQRDPKQRATAAQLLAHEWLTCPDKALEEVPLPDVG
ncbi:protein kinase [Novymonas esmeraldas]|uniref:Protein kinase n=1 Tax=Novymonas esmeraldas TaxID=1808958 RepID=A0AAW0EN39_9TRYP